MNVRNAISLGVIVCASLLLLCSASILLGQTSDTASSPGRWSGWHTVPNGGTTDAAPFAISYSGKLYLFARGINDHAIYMNTYTSAGWSGFSLLEYGLHTDVELCGAVCNNKLEIYILPDDTGYWGNVHRFTNDNGYWSESACSDIVFVGKHMGAIADGPAVYLFTHGYADNLIYYWLDDTYNNRAGPAPVLPGNATTDVALGGCVWQGQMWLFGKGIGDSKMYYTLYKDGNWAGVWWVFGGGLQTDVSPAATIYKNVQYVFVKEKLTNRIYCLLKRTPSTPSWSETMLSGPLTEYAVSTTVYNGKLYLFAVANDQTLMYNVLTSK
jgi:hypothetical protein